MVKSLDFFFIIKSLNCFNLFEKDGELKQTYYATHPQLCPS